MTNKGDTAAAAEGILDNRERILIGGSGIDVPKDVHGSELPETDGTVERQHPLPDVLRRDNRSDSSADKLQTAG